MRKYVFSIFMLLSVAGLSIFTMPAQENYEYVLSVYNQDVAKESAFILKNSDESGLSIESNTVLDSSDEKAVYRTISSARESKITDYSLEIDFNEKNMSIDVTLKDGIYIIAFEERVLEIEDDSVVIVDNNISWPWQIFFDYHEKAKKSEYNALIPQLIAYGDSVTIPLTVTNRTEFEDEINLFIKLGNNSGLIKANKEGKVHTVLIGVAKSELK